MNRIDNSRGMITHEVKVNIYYQNHIERIRMDVCDLGRTEVMLGMLWLAAHNLEINWETREVKITRCSLVCGRNLEIKKKVKTKEKTDKKARVLDKAD